MDDPRRSSRGNFLYPLEEVLFLTVSAVISGITDYTDIEQFGKAQLDWLRKYHPYRHGVPSHDTIGNLFARLDHDLFSDLFTQWVTQSLQLPEQEVVALDGKRLRGSYDTANGAAALHLVSAFATSYNLCLAQRITDSKTNEISVIPQVMDQINLKGCIVTIDAMGCQHAIAEKVLEKGADYLLGVKANQKDLLQQVEKAFQINAIQDVHHSHDMGHGRIEQRVCEVIQDPNFWDVDKPWKGLKAIIKVTRRRTQKINDQTSEEVAYYITSCKEPTAEKMNQAIRAHWQIENNLHRVLDVTFGEDAARKRKNHSAANFSLIKKAVMALLKRSDLKFSLKHKRLHASWDNSFREKLLNL